MSEIIDNQPSQGLYSHDSQKELKYSPIIKDLLSTYNLAQAISNNAYLYILFDPLAKGYPVTAQIFNTPLSLKEIRGHIALTYKYLSAKDRPQPIACFHLAFYFDDQISIADFDPFDVHNWETLIKFPVGFRNSNALTLYKPPNVPAIYKQKIDFSRVANKTTHPQTLKMIRNTWVQAVIVNDNVIRTPKRGDLHEAINTSPMPA
jgi:hypothetical protein